MNNRVAEKLLKAEVVTKEQFKAKMKAEQDIQISEG